MFIVISEVYGLILPIILVDSFDLGRLRGPLIRILFMAPGRLGPALEVTGHC